MRIILKTACFLLELCYPNQDWVKRGKARGKQQSYERLKNISLGNFSKIETSTNEDVIKE